MWSLHILGIVVLLGYEGVVFVSGNEEGTCSVYQTQGGSDIAGC